MCVIIASCTVGFGMWSICSSRAVPDEVCLFLCCSSLVTEGIEELLAPFDRRLPVENAVVGLQDSLVFVHGVPFRQLRVPFRTPKRESEGPIPQKYDDAATASIVYQAGKVLINYFSIKNKAKL